jgi:hypothetical protein
VKIIWHGFHDRKVVTASIRGKILEAQAEEHRWLDRLPSFDPFETEGPDYKSDVFTVEFANSKEVFELTWKSELNS